MGRNSYSAAQMTSLETVWEKEAKELYECYLLSLVGHIYEEQNIKDECFNTTSKCMLHIRHKPFYLLTTVTT